MNKTRRALFKSVVALILCFSMLISTTWAWFTDGVTSAGNKIQSGTLKVDLELLDKKTDKWHSLKENSDPIFDYDNWEPGYTVENILKIENEGSLALKWVAKFVSDDELSILADVIDVYVKPSATELAYSDTRNLEGYTRVGTVAEFVNSIEETTKGTLEAGKAAYLGIVLKMRENAGNEYQGLSLGGAFDILVVATQWTGEFESDSFDNQYDKDATYPSILDKLKLTADITDKVDADGKLTEEVKLYDRYSGVLVTVPVGTRVADGAKKLTLRITEDSVYGKITLDLRVGYDVSVDGISENNTVPIIVNMPKVLPKEQTGLQLYHAGNAMTRVYTVEALSGKEGDNDTYGDKFLYDPATGDVTFSVTHFSNVSLASTTSVIVNGKTKDGIKIDLSDPGDYLVDGKITIPADGNTYILTWDSGDMSKKNALDLTLTHTWHNLNPGTYSSTPVKVEKGAKVILNGVNIRTDSTVDAIELVNPAGYAGEKLAKTYIYVADGTQNWLTGKSGIGFGANGTYNATADIYVEGAGNLYTTAMGWGSPGIGIDSYSDGNQSNMHFNVGFLRSIPMNAAAGIGGGFAGQSWFCLKLMEFNGGTYHVYRGGDAASIGTGRNGDCGDIIINAGSNVYCYTNPWTAYGRNIGHGMYAGTCSGIYVSKDAYVYGWNYQTRSYGEWVPNTGYVPGGRQQDATVIVENFDSADISIVSSTSVAGVLTEVKVEINGEVVTLDASKCSFDGTNVTVTAVIKDGKVYYLNSPTASIAKTAEVNKVITISSIEASGYKAQYYVGDEYDPTGLKLTVNYSEGDPIEITEGFTVTGFDSSTVGEKTLTVTYKGKTTTFVINVEGIAPVSAVITAPLTKTEYFVGEELDLSGLVITVTNNNGSTETIDSNFSVSGFNTNTAGTQTITVTITENIKVTFDVEVNKIVPTGIEILSSPNKTTYKIGENLDFAGLKVKVTYNNGTPNELTEGFTFIGFDNNKTEKHNVTVSYTEDGTTVTATFEVTPILPVSATITAGKDKTEYKVGDQFDPSGIELTVTYSDNTTHTFKYGEGITVDAPQTLAVGTHTIKVSYMDKSDEFTVTVKPNATFLYRVGNQNNVTLAQIATMLTKAEHDGSNVTIENNIGAAEYNGSKFTGTGIVKVTIGENDYYYLEVVNAVNTTTGNIRNNGLLYGTNFVLLCDVEYTETQTVTMEGSTIYGNGFKYDFSKFTPQANELSNVFVIHMKNATLDNVQIIGKVYTDGAYVYKADSSADPENYMSLLFATGESKILNSYVSGTRAPVRVEGNVEITNSTLAGGNVANIDVKSGVLTLNNVTTINQGTNPVGYGIFMDFDSGKDEDGNDRPITININGLNSYNWLTAADEAHMNDMASKSKPMPTLLNSVFADAQFAGAEAVNFRVVCLNTNNNVEVNGLGDPLIASISGNNGRLWCEKGSLVTAPDYKSDGTGTVPPVFTWSEYSATTEFTKGGSVTFNADLLTAQKYGQNLTVTISCTGGTINGKNITFNTAGDYTIKYDVTDSNNYRLDSEGKLEQYTEYYTAEIVIKVNEVEPQTKHATIKLGGSETKEVLINGKKFLVPVDYDKNASDKWHNVNGYYWPVVSTIMSDGINGEHSSRYSAYFPIFGDAVEITDYADNGTGAAVTYKKDTVDQNTPVKNQLKFVECNDSRQGTPALAWQSSSKGTTEPFYATPGGDNGDWYLSTPGFQQGKNAHSTYIMYSYTDNMNETYYYIVWYETAKQTYKSCVTSDTLVMLADGTQKRIDQVTYDDQLLVWNFFEGKYDVVPSAIIFYHGDDNYKILNLNFEDGTTVKVINNHGFFDMEKNEFIYISEKNVDNYIGDHFAKVNGDGRTAVKLVGYTITEEYTGCYSILSAMHNNFMVEGMFSMTIPEIEGFCDYFEIGEGMKYDEEKMQADIEKYGLYTYDDFAEYITYEQFIAFNGPYLKVLVGRGVLTFDQILGLISSYVVIG